MISPLYSISLYLFFFPSYALVPPYITHPCATTPLTTDPLRICSCYGLFIPNGFVSGASSTSSPSHAIHRIAGFLKQGTSLVPLPLQLQPKSHSSNRLPACIACLPAVRNLLTLPTAKHHHHLIVTAAMMPPHTTHRDLILAAF